MSDKIWRFQGQLQENENRVITSASGTVSEINQGETPSLDIKSENGQLYIDLKVPTKKVESFDIGGVGKQFTIDGSPTSPTGQNYGEIFNDYTNNTASGLWSHAVGYGSKADYPYQAVFGKFNDNKKNNVFEIGYGNSDTNRHNIFEIDKEGNIKIDGDITNGNNLSLSSLNQNKLDKVQFDYLVSESQPRIHRLTNKDIITVTTAETVLVDDGFLTTTATNPLFWATVAFTLSTNATVTFKYYLDGVLQSDDTIVETYTAGAHFASLFNVYEMEENYYGALKVTMTVSAGTATIAEYAFKGALYIQGVGITAAFAGKLKFTDSFGIIDREIQPMSLLRFNSAVQIETQEPIQEGLHETFGYFNLESRAKNILDFSETFGVNTPITNTTYVFDVNKKASYIYNQNNIIINNNAFMLNTVDQPEILITNAIDLNDSPNITSINQVTLDSDGDILIAVSFDEKNSWLVFNGVDWSITSSDIEGMNKETLEVITSEQWAVALGDSKIIYFKAIFSNVDDALRKINIEFLMS